MFNRLSHYVNHLMFSKHFPLYHLNYLLLQKVIDVCQDSQPSQTRLTGNHVLCVNSITQCTLPCQEDLDCHLSEWAARCSCLVGRSCPCQLILTKPTASVQEWVKAKVHSTHTMWLGYAVKIWIIPSLCISHIRGNDVHEWCFFLGCINQ